MRAITRLDELCREVRWRLMSTFLVTNVGRVALVPAAFVDSSTKRSGQVWHAIVRFFFEVTASPLGFGMHRRKARSMLPLVLLESCSLALLVLLACSAFPVARDKDAGESNPHS